MAWVTDNWAHTHFSCSVPLSSSVVLSHTLSCCESVQMTYVSVGPEAHKPPRSSLRDRSKGFPKERFLNMVLTRIYTHIHRHTIKHQTEAGCSYVVTTQVRCYCYTLTTVARLGMCLTEFSTSSSVTSISMQQLSSSGGRGSAPCLVTHGCTWMPHTVRGETLTWFLFSIQPT